MALIFFIPGTACNEKLWSELWPLLQSDGVANEPTALEQNHQLVHLSLPKAGTMVEVVGSLVSQIQHISGGKHFYLIGFSLGGYLASAVSDYFANELQKLMVIANIPRKLPDAELSQRQLIIKAISKMRYKGLSVDRVLTFLAPDQRHNLAIIQTILAMDATFAHNDLLHHLDALSDREDLCEKLACASRDVWFCYGEYDHLVDESDLQVMSQHASNIVLQKIAQSGHFVPLEQPVALANIIKQWLN